MEGGGDSIVGGAVHSIRELQEVEGGKNVANRITVIVVRIETFELEKKRFYLD